MTDTALKPMPERIYALRTSSVCVVSFSSPSPCFNIEYVRADLVAALPEPAQLPQDVINLVIAAREVAYEDFDPEKIKALDTASEAFASRVPWDNEPRNSCSTCKGRGIVGGLYRVGDGDVDAWEEPCSDCSSAHPHPVEVVQADVRPVRPERVQAAFEFFVGNADTGPNATAMFEYIERLEAVVAEMQREKEGSREHPDQTSPMTVGPENFLQSAIEAARTEGKIEAYEDLANHQRKYVKLYREKADKLRAALNSEGA